MTDIVNALIVGGFIAGDAFIIAEIALLTSAYRLDSTVVALRERTIASVCRLIGVLGFQGLLLNRIFWDALTNEVISVIGAVSIVALTIPAIRFVRLYLSHGFR